MLTIIIADLLKPKAFSKILESDNIKSRLPFCKYMFAAGWVAFFAVLCLEIYGIKIGVSATSGKAPSPPLPACKG